MRTALAIGLAADHAEDAVPGLKKLVEEDRESALLLVVAEEQVDHWTRTASIKT